LILIQRDLELKEKIISVINEKVKKESDFMKFLRVNFTTIYKVIEILRTDSNASLYNGLSSALFGTVVTQGVYFGSYKFFKIFLKQLNFQKGIVIDSIITSLLSAVVTAIVSNPIWVFNTRMASKNVRGILN
jgi:hypothetical protein